MIRVQNLGIQQGDFALNGVSFEVPDRAYAVVMGRSGSGKTTILELICGLRQMHSGFIELGCGVVADVKNGDQSRVLQPGERQIGYVPQDGALFPTMTVAEHWRRHVEAWLGLRHRALLRVRYEDLVRDPVAEIARIANQFDFLDLPDTVQTVDQPTGLLPNRAQIDAWRDAYSEADLDFFHSIVPRDFVGLDPVFRG